MVKKNWQHYTLTLFYHWLYVIFIDIVSSACGIMYNYFVLDKISLVMPTLLEHPSSPPFSISYL